MKTTWRIVTLSHDTPIQVVVWWSRMRIGEVQDGRMCVSIDVDTFTDVAFLVVARWMKLDKVKAVIDDCLNSGGWVGK